MSFVPIPPDPAPDDPKAKRAARLEKYQSAAKVRAAKKGGKKLAPLVICPHCNTKGLVYAGPTKVKRGISGGKATGAVLTAGVSLLATGLSRKEKLTAMSCANCGINWII